LRSELNLADQRDARLAQTLPKFAALEQADITQDKPKAVGSKVTHQLNDALECDALVALKELGAQVARRKGMDVSSFVRGLNSLLASADIVESSSGSSFGDIRAWSPTSIGYLKASTDDVTLKPQAHKFMTHIRQDGDHQSQRHFSFDPGDDHMRVLCTDLRFCDSLHTEPTDYASPSSSEGSLREGDGSSVLPLPSAGVDIMKQSMVPSPVQRVGSNHQENSWSSPQSMFIKNVQDDRQSSRASVQTVFFNTSSAAFSSRSKSTGGLSQALGVANSALKSKERPSNLANQHSAALAAARAAEARSNDPSRSNTRSSTTAPHSRTQHPARRSIAENHDSKKLERCK
jgi:hypothetical protein